MTPASRLKEMCRPNLDNMLTHQHQLVTRLWQKDHTLWQKTPTEISNRLGWLELPQSMRAGVTVLADFVEEARARRFRDVVLLGMGGSSLCAEVLRQTFPTRQGFPCMHVLDSTFPQWVKQVEDRIAPEHTLFLVSSKSGGTIEVMSFYKYFRSLVEAAKGDRAGENFVAITDSGSPLESVAADTGFWRTFINRSDVGGRYSVLSYFGLVPAALMGLDVGELLARGREGERACGVTNPVDENPGAWLGLLIGCLAKAGRDKLTLITSPGVATFGLWAEQLIAESSGKNDRGIVPIAGEPCGPVSAYGDDRIFVYLRLADDDNEATDRHVEALDNAGFPVLKEELLDPYDLGNAFFRWEFAIAVACACMEVNAFDQPNVQESKEITKRVLSDYESKGSLPELKDEGDFGELLSSAAAGDYVAFMAYTGNSPEIAEAVDAARSALLTKRRLPSTFGYGPRFLHSTGQLHKGGKNNGLFVQITVNSEDEIPIPGEAYSFSTLVTAQALGDFQALREHKRRAIRIHVSQSEHIAERLQTLVKTI